MGMKKTLTRGMAMLLTLTLLISAIPTQGLAYYAQKPDNLSIVDSKGETVTVGEDWATTFPYGTFAFSESDLSVDEGGDGTIKVYRLGGTKGRASAYITYAPVTAEIKAGVKTYANAASSDDVEIRVEDTLPVAMYQPLGKDPDPLEPQAAVAVTVEERAETQDVCLTVDQEADTYQWYLLTDGYWEIVTGATNKEFIASSADYDAYDFRCVYTVGSERFCSDSAKGVEYARPEQEVVPEQPEDLELNPETTYTLLEMDDPDSYAGYVFELTFAEDEWVKEIHVSSPDDAAAEADEFGMFTIAECEGGSLYDSANTLLMHVADNEAPEPSQIGFMVTHIEADKAKGTARLTVKRTGGTQNVLSVEYATADGTAVSGEDYSSASGTLMFYADVSQQTIEIPLINDGVATNDQVSFTVTLSQLKGDQAGICELTDTEATVGLYNTATAEDPNLATLLYDEGSVDVSDVAEEDSAIAPAAQAITGQEVADTEEPIAATLTAESGNELDPLTYNYPNKLSFSYDSGNSNWKDWVYVANNNGRYSGYSVNAVGGYTGTSWSGGSRYGASGWCVESKGSASATLNIAYMNQLYDRFMGNFTWRAAIGSSLYDLEYTYPWFRILNSGGGTIGSADAGTRGSGDFWSGTEISWYKSGTIDRDWSIASQTNRLQLGLSRYDCHDANSTALGALENGVLRRRVFSNPLALRVFTANDSGSGQGGVKTSPDGAASLTEVSGVYGSMTPKVEIEPGKGGVNSAGRLYVGTQLKVTLANTASYFPAKEDSSLSYAVYLTNAAGAVVASSGSTGNVHNLILRWDSMTDADLGGSYTINIVMTRKQTLNIDISPSVARLILDGKIQSGINPAEISTAVNDFWSSTSGITYGYSAVDNTATHFTYRTDGTLSRASFQASSTGTAADAVLSAANIKNLQWVNFNLPSEDVILYNGRAYAGNEKIWLAVSDLALSDMTFRYYDKQHLTTGSIMTTNISQTALYLDANANGRIDGWYNRYTGYFVLDETAGDEFLYFLEPGIDYDESVFAPVPKYGKDASGNTVITGYCQYFLKTYYTMTPRCLTVPEGASVNDPAQVLPALVADVTDPNTYAALTPEQQAYRYVVSGQSRAYTPGGADHNVVTPAEGDYARSADNHLMYGAAASDVSCVDIPLGGDHSPPVLTEDGKDFTWSPDYHGNLLYRFPSPQPIAIPHSLAGDNIPIAEVISIDPSTGAVTFRYANAANKLNGYLGSLSANDTYALCVQEQKHTTGEIAAANGVSIPDLGLMSESGMAQPEPESIRLASSGSFPNSDYLKKNNAGGTTAEPNLSMSESDNEFDEFNLDLGVKLPSSEIGITDYVTIIMDEYEVGFAIGIPVGGYNSNGDAGSGGVGGGGESGGSNWFGPKKANASNAEDMGKLRDFLKKPSQDTFKDTSDSYKQAKDSGKMKSSSFEVNFSISMAFLFKYNSVDNAYYFSQFSVAATAELEYTYQYRLTPCPIVYLYVTVNVTVEIGTGMTVDRDAIEETSLALPESKEMKLKKGQSYVLETNRKAFNATFDGKLYLECFKTDALTEPVDGFNKGYVKSEGDDPVTVTLFKQDGNELPATYYVRFTALEDTTLSRVARIIDMRSDVYWNGFEISPEAFVEAGAGIGVEICKFEVFIKVNIGCKMTLGAYNKEDKTYEPFEFNEFEFGLGLGFRVVLLVFSYEMDLIKYTITYDSERPEDKKWVHSWSALGGLYGGDIGTLSATDADGNTMAVHIRLPGSTAETQTIYAPENSDALSPLSYSPTDAKVPFQLSGYGSSGDAFKLADGLVTGYDYKVVTVGKDNYLIYTVGRTADNEVDYTMLVLSKLKLTKAASSGEKDSYGLVHPVTGAAGGYLILDDDGTGDLGFNAWVEGSVIHAQWVSYAAPSAQAPVYPTEPNATTYPKPVGTDGTTEMDKTNYSDLVLFPVLTNPTAPTEPAQPRPDPEATQPTDPKPAAAPDPTDTTKYPQGADDDAYKADLAVYNAWVAWELELDWVEYDQDKTAYDSAKEEYDAYIAWHDFFETTGDVNAYYQTRAANAAKNTVIKTASFTVKASYTGDEAFTDATVVSGAVGSHVFLPDSAGDGSAVFFARSIHYTDAEETEAQADYTDYLNTAYPEASSASIRSYRALYQKGLRDVYGKGTTLYVAVNGAVAAGCPTLSAGQTLENLEVMDAGSGVYYLAYTTNQQTYTANELTAIRRLYLRRVTVDAENNAVWSAPYLLRTLVDNDQDSAEDGVYSASLAAPSTVYKDPYFANLQFLYGKLGTLTNGEALSTLAESAQSENFLLFEMNGSTYIIPAADLGTITSDGTGKIYPFFRPETVSNADGSTATATSTGRAEVTIGADGAGNISAVYVATVPNTTNNALFLTKYDPNTNAWGTGIMLAMNYMQVHEDSVTQGLTAAETEAAFLAAASGGGMDQFAFSNLQIALGQKNEAVSGQALDSLSETGSAASAPVDQELAADYGLTGGLSTLSESQLEEKISGLSDSQIETLAGETASTQDTLLVITQGDLTYLEQRQYEDANGDNQTMIAPMSDEDAQEQYLATGGNRKPGVGFYAVSYGVGGQRIGEDHLAFVNYNFTAGSELKSSISFMNTGDVTIRGSQSNPITIKLKVITPAGVDTQLDAWTVSQNIAAGQTVKLSGTASALADTLPTGSVFYLTVSEDADYITSIGGTAFFATTLVKDAGGLPVSGTLTVAQKPELGFENCEIKSTGVDAAGNTILTVEFQVGNRGNKTAEGVYVQFTYENGEDADTGKPVYSPVDLTGHHLVVSKQAELDTLAQSSADELKSGILRLYNAEDGDSIGTNKGRTVTGTITVSPACYKGGITGSLNLNLEIFSSSDQVTAVTAGVVTAEHGEYNSVNNTAATQLEHTTYFSAADKVTLAMGNTMRLPVTITTTTGQPPQISVVEMPDGDDAKNNLGILYYNDDGNFVSGHTTGTLVIAPSTQGSGIIHLMDTATNAIYPIAYSVTAHTEGINIFKDNSLFTFKNANGSNFDSTQLNQSWEFREDIPVWGTGVSADTPYLSNLSYGSAGASFTFRTVAQSVDLYFNGEAKVESTFPGFAAQTVSASGGKTKATVSFGANTTNYPHDVTVTVLSSTGAQFDRMVEKYASGEAPTPSDDATAPHIYWSRSFPETASIQTGTNPVALTCYILDDTGLASVTYNGTEPALTKNDAGFWQFDTTVTANGAFSVTALDSAGNRTARTVTADWFNQTVSADAKANAPALTGQFQFENGDAVGSSFVKQGESTFLKATTAATASANYISAETDSVSGAVSLETTKLTSGEDGRFPVATNGYYQLTATAADGTWRTVLMNMDRLDKAQPELKFSETVLSGQSGEGERALSWAVNKGDTSLSPITQVTINGLPMTITPDQTWVAGTWPISFGGLYTLEAKDAAGNSATATCTVSDYDIDVGGAGAFAVTHSWSQARNNGSITIDSDQLSGGLYDAALSTSSIYHGSYQFLLLPAAQNYSFDADAARKTILEQYAAAHPEAPDMPADELAAALLSKQAESRAAWLTDLVTLSDADWTANETISGIAPGSYTLYVRDAQDKTNINVIAAQTLTLNDEAVTFATETRPASRAGGENGSVTVSASGGKLAQGTYQFAVLPMKDKETPLADVKDLAAQPGVTWQLADVSSGSFNTKLLDGLKPGWYQVAVRPMGVSAGTMSNLCTLYDTLVSAQTRKKKAADANTAPVIVNAAASAVAEIRTAQQKWDAAIADSASTAETETVYKSLIGSDAGILTLLGNWRAAEEAVTAGTMTRAAADAVKKLYDDAVDAYADTKAKADASKELADANLQLTDAQTNYNTAAQAAAQAADQAYTLNPELWINACTRAVEVGFETSKEISSSDLDRSETGKITVIFIAPMTKLSVAAVNALINENKTNTIAIKSSRLFVIIPPGTLSQGDNIMNMLLLDTELPDDPTGYVVRVTSADGKTHIVPMSLVGKDRIAYIAAQPGRYSIAYNGKTFEDVKADFWGAEAVGFAAANELFQGTGPNTFGPNRTMTRGMLVTVLGRLMGVDQTKYTGKAYSDVPTGTWYSACVQWASENGIVTGYGNGNFGPNDAITREQMCTILVRFLKAQGITLPEQLKNEFSDAGSVSGWAAEAVKYCQQAGLIQGVGGDRVNPRGESTRAEVATVLMRMIEGCLSE